MEEASSSPRQTLMAYLELLLRLKNNCSLMYARFFSQCKQPHCPNCLQHFSDLGHGFAGAAEGVTLRRNIKTTHSSHFKMIMGKHVGMGLEPAFLPCSFSLCLLFQFDFCICGSQEQTCSRHLKLGICELFAQCMVLEVKF